MRKLPETVLFDATVSQPPVKHTELSTILETSNKAAKALERELQTLHSYIQKMIDLASQLVKATEAVTHYIAELNKKE